MTRCSWFGLALSAAFGIGCSGIARTTPAGDDLGSGGSGDPGSTDTGPAACSLAEFVAPSAPLRRLTRREYDNTVRDLLGDDTHPARAFAEDARPGPFMDNSDAAATALTVSQYADAADALASATVAKRLDRLVGCGATGDDNCARTFVRDFGRRAYRRPLTDAEQQRLFAVYRAERDAGAAFTDGVRLVVTVMLQSPHFINHVEHGESDQGATTALTAYERASRLSYFVWGSMPDDALFAAAEAGKLKSSVDVEAQARRLLDDPRAKEGVASFFDQWLRLDRVAAVDRNRTLFPEWSDALRDAFLAETTRFLEHVMWEGDARLGTLLTAPFSFVNQSLAGLYGVTGVKGDALVRTDLDPTRRSGLLTQASLLAITAKYDQTSPVQRGLQVRERFLCQMMPSPPANVNISVPQPQPNQTTRQRFDSHRADPYCNGCHRLMDPIGLGFENYDPIGRYRDTENGNGIDAAGSIVDSEDLDGDFNGVVDLAGSLAGSKQARTCMATLWLSYGTGVLPEKLTCAGDSLARDLAAADGDLKSLIVGVAKSQAFLQRPTLTSEECP